MQPTETQIFWNEDWDLVHQTLPARCSMCVNDLFQLYAVAVHTIPDRFPSGGGGGVLPSNRGLWVCAAGWGRMSEDWIDYY